jgi:hypothetical protein
MDEDVGDLVTGGFGKASWWEKERLVCGVETWGRDRETSGWGVWVWV